MIKAINITGLCNINLMRTYTDEQREIIRRHAREWYHNNRERGLANVKKRYQKNKDDPEFIANKNEIRAKSRHKNLIDVRIGALDYYYRNKDKILEKHKNGILFLGKYFPLPYLPRRGICSQCQYQGFTAIHHIMYDPADPADLHYRAMRQMS